MYSTRLHSYQISFRGYRACVAEGSAEAERAPAGLHGTSASMACGLEGRGPEAVYAKWRAPIISFEALEDMSATPIRSKSAKLVKAQNCRSLNPKGHPSSIDQTWSRQEQTVMLAGFCGYESRTKGDRRVPWIPISQFASSDCCPCRTCCDDGRCQPARR